MMGAQKIQSRTLKSPAEKQDRGGMVERDFPFQVKEDDPP